MSRPRPMTSRIAAATIALLLATVLPARAQAIDPEPAPGTAVAPAATAPAGPTQESVAPRAPTRETYTFQVTLLRARGGDSSLPDLPEEALAALRDLQDLTRYRSFEVLDTAWLRTQRAARARLGEAGAFEVYLAMDQPQPAPPAPAGETRAAGAAPRRIIVEHFEVAYWRWDSDDEGNVYYSEDPVELVTSTFGLELGETAVVATSRLTDGDEALVVLVKAVE